MIDPSTLNNLNNTALGQAVTQAKKAPLISNDYASYFMPRARGLLKSDAQFPYAYGGVKIINGVAQAIGNYNTLDFKGGTSAGMAAARGITASAVDVANAYLKKQGIYGQKGVRTSFVVGGASGRSAKLGAGLFVGNPDEGGFSQGAQYTNLATQQSFEYSIQQLLAGSTQKYIKSNQAKEKPTVYTKQPVIDTTQTINDQRKQAARRFMNQGRAATYLTTQRPITALPTARQVLS